jgi:hypothetical protein
MFSARPPMDMSDDEIKDFIRKNTQTTMVSVNDLLRELDRRATERHADALRALTKWLVGATIVYTLATLALVVVTWLKL